MKVMLYSLFEQASVSARNMTYFSMKSRFIKSFNWYFKIKTVRFMAMFIQCALFCIYSFETTPSCTNRVHYTRSTREMLNIHSS